MVNWRLKPIAESLPWVYFASGYKINFWLGALLKAVLKFDFKIERKKVAIVFNVFSNNYFHWLTEVLPKIHYIQKTDKNAFFLFPDNFKNDYQVTTLKDLNVNVIYFKEKIVFCTNATYFSGFTEYPGYYEPNSLLGIRSKILKTNNDAAPANLVYISRKSASRRKIINEEEILELVKKYNFSVYDFDTLPFSRILEIAQNARVIISIHGAALTNMMFMKKGTVIFELQKEHIVIDKCYFFLANALGINYYYQTCKPNDDTKSHIFADIIVDKTLFQKNLEKIIDTL